jgi:uncharacterized membrane protein YfcA
MPDVEWIVLYMALGTCVGFLAGLLGLGGGGILVPLLAAIFTYQGIGGDSVMHLALGTALTCMIISSTASVRAHAARGTVVWRVVGSMALGIMLGAFLATQIAAYIHSTYIALFFALFMAMVAAQMFLNWKPKPSQTPMTFNGLMATGMGIGSVSALAAVGGGFLTVVYLGYKNVDMKKAIGTSAAIGFPIAVTGAAGYMISGWSHTSGIPYTLGYVYVPALLAISISSVIAAPYGVRCSHGLPETSLKKIFAVISLMLSIKMFVSFVQF